MRIKDVEDLVGVSKKSIRFYEKEGLILPGRTTDNGYRDYSDEDVARLKRIKLLRKLDMPIREIREILDEQTSLTVAARRHVIYLEGMVENINSAKAICQMLIDDRATAAGADVDAYLEKMEEMEKGGALFVNIEKKDTIKKYAGPVIVSAVIILLMAILIYGFVYAALHDPIPLGVLILFLAVFLVVIVGTVTALISRIREIRGGEEDDLSNY